MSNRDDFTKKTVAELAKRVAWLCSNPHCRKVTIGAKQGGAGVNITGTAAHITAAAPRGPRYNASLSQADRKDISNGIWLCNNCATLIDRNEKAFPTSLLYEWKREAEEQSFAALAGSSHNVQLARKIPVELDETDREMIQRLGLPHENNIEIVTAELRTAAQKDIEAFKREKSWPRHPVSLIMTYRDSCGAHSWSHEDLAIALEVTSEVSITADPGTGKTTAMIQIAVDTLNSDNGGVAVLIPLAEWSTRQETLFQSLLHRNSFRNYKEQHFMLLAYFGRLLLLLDGWNELDSASKSRFISDLKVLRREFPLLRLALSTRRQVGNLPISGPIIELESLSEDQQAEIARALKGEDGVALLEQAWRTEGVSELVSIPLYFTSLLTYATRGTMPSNKEEVLRLFVEEHGKAPERAEALNRVLFGCHRDILIGLASEAMNCSSTTIKESRARMVVSDIESNLVKAGQITNRPEPLNVINVLVDQHLLVSVGSDRGISFQHQQFQEWYASFRVEELMVSSSAGNDEALKELRANVLNVPFWEESILFACERLSVGDKNAVCAVGHTILQCIAIDPMLAAEMIYRSSSKVWDAVKADIISFVSRWHKPNKIDRALSFMITTGKPEFSTNVCPLVFNADPQVHLKAIGVAKQFRPGVLGDSVKAIIEALPEGTRESVITAIVTESGIDGILLAVDVAKTETSANVQASVISFLIFRGAERFAVSILKDAPPDVWKMIASEGVVNVIADAEITERLQREYQSYIAGIDDPLKKLKLVLEAHESIPNAAKQVEEIIISEEFPVKESDAYWTLMDVKVRYASELTSAILRRIETGREIPYQSKTLLRDAMPVENGYIVDLVTNTEHENHLADIAVVVVGEKTVRELIDKLLEFNEKANLDDGSINEATIQEHSRLIRRICNSHPKAFLSALEYFRDTCDPKRIAALADLLDRFGQNIETELINVEETANRPPVLMIIQWIEVILSTPSADRHQYSELARVIARFPRIEYFDYLCRMLDEELKLAKQPEHSHIVYTNLYAKAFSAIGDERVVELMIGYLTDTQFGNMAAHVLKGIWDKQNDDGIKPFSEAPNFRQAAEIHRHRKTNGETTTSQFAEAIFAAVIEMLRTESDEARYRQILKLASIALSMPHGDKTSILSELLALPLPLSEKHVFLTSLVAAGYEIDSDLVIQGLRNLIDEAKQKPWLLDEQANRIGNWLMLLPFTNNPEALHEAFELSKAYLKAFWQVRRLLSALAFAPSMQAEASLFKLAEDDPRFYQEHEWIGIIVRRGTASAVHKLVAVICDGKLTDKEHGLDSWSLAKKISCLFECHPEAYRELIRLYESAPKDIKDQVEFIIAEVVDEEGLFAIIRRYGKDGRHFDERLEQVVISAALGRKQIKSNMFSFYRIEVSNLRKKLFTMVIRGEPASDLAASCLTTIDKVRDEYGCMDSEPRHPDIESGWSWPLEAVEQR